MIGKTVELQMTDEFMEFVFEAHRKSYERAFEIAVRTGTALIFEENGKIVKERPPYRYELVKIQKNTSDTQDS